MTEEEEEKIKRAIYDITSHLEHQKRNLVIELFNKIAEILEETYDFGYQKGSETDDD